VSDRCIGVRHEDEVAGESVHDESSAVARLRRSVADAARQR